MGYSFGWQDKKSLVNELTKNSITYKLVGNCLWSVNKHPTEDYNYIGLDLINYDRKHKEYGYKPMVEREHPYYYSCPLSFLKKAKETSHEWRIKVNEYHNDKEELKLGDIISLHSPSVKSVKLTGKIKKSWLGVDINNKLWKITPKFIGKKIPELI